MSELRDQLEGSLALAEKRQAAESAVLAPKVTSEELELVKRTVASGATDAELKLFLFDCARQGVHPLDRLIHFTKRSGKYTPITSIDFMRIRAADSGEMAGSDEPLFSPRDRPQAEPPQEATVTVYRLTQGQRFAYTATARWSEYKPESNDFMWKRMPHTMLGKCAEALALRKGFPRQLSGLYAKEEMEQAGPEAPSPMQPDPPETVLNVQTGEVVPASARPTPPAGYHYLDAYKPDGAWHHVTINRYFPDGSALTVKTKLSTVGAAAREAYQEGAPVKVSWKPNDKPKEEGWLNKIERWSLERELEAHTQPVTSDSIPF